MMTQRQQWMIWGVILLAFGLLSAPRKSRDYRINVKDSGQIQELLVKPGQVVKAGQVIARYRKPQTAKVARPAEFRLAADTVIIAPVSGKIVKLLAQPGDQIQSGSPLLILRVEPRKDLVSI